MDNGANVKNRGKKNLFLTAGITLVVVLIVIVVLQRYNISDESTLTDQSPSEYAVFKQEVESKWNMPFDKLPQESLVVITPHHDAIQEKFEIAFVKHYALEKGQRVMIWWRHPGGSNAIMDLLLEQTQKQDPLPLDVVFGGGEYLFEQLAEHNMLVPMDLEQDTLTQIPSEFAGVRLYEPRLHWCGNVLSGFGFLFDRQKIHALGLTEPASWQDLARPELIGQLAVANPQNSGSTMMAFEMILQSEPDWPSGWKTLLSILSNAKELMTSSDDAANAPLFDQAAAAICIDFYGFSRQALEPEKLQYITPQGQTAFMPDPIGILTDAPNKEVAREFVKFVLSDQGQLLWGQKIEQQRVAFVTSLYRTPIRKDFYSASFNDIPENIKNPYELAKTVHFDSELRSLRYNVLRQLVRAAAVENYDAMVKARKALIDSDSNGSMAKTFFQLPDNIDTLEEVRSVSEKLKDPEQSEQIFNEWTGFFRLQYQKVSQ